MGGDDHSMENLSISIAMTLNPEFGAHKLSHLHQLARSSQAPSYASESETMNLSLTDSLTGVKCRATSVAKKRQEEKMTIEGTSR